MSKKRELDWDEVRRLRFAVKGGATLSQNELDYLLQAFWADRKRYKQIGLEVAKGKRKPVADEEVGEVL